LLIAIRTISDRKSRKQSRREVWKNFSFLAYKEKEERRCECSHQTQWAVTEGKAVFCFLRSQKEAQEAGGSPYRRAIQVNTSSRKVKCHEDNGLHHLLLGCAL